MDGAYAECDGWVVDIDDNTGDDTLRVNIRNQLIYLDFWCGGLDKLRTASEFLRSARADGSLRIGSFCNELFVELDCFAQESESVYLSVTRPNEQSMAYCLRNQDRESLARALLTVVEVLSKRAGDGV